MSMQGIVTGNLAETPIKAKGTAHMSPTEKAAFEVPVDVPQVDVLEASPNGDAPKWEKVGQPESFSARRLGDSSNEFVQTTARLKVEGGWIYATTVNGLGYVRGTCSVATSVSTVFVPDIKKR